MNGLATGTIGRSSLETIEGEYEKASERVGWSLQINDLGMDFGIWVEPEMVNVDSELYKGAPGLGDGYSGQKSFRGEETSGCST